MQEAVRLRLPTIASGYDVVMIARPAIRDATFLDVDRSVGELLQRAGLAQPAASSPSQTEPSADSGRN